MDAFKNAIASGIPGLETDCWLTADGELVMDHNGVVTSWFGLRRKRLISLARSVLPGHFATLSDLYAIAPVTAQISIDVKDSEGVPGILDVARSSAADATSRLWLAHKGAHSSDWRLVASWRALDDSVGLVDSTRVRRMDLSPRDYAKRALDNGITAINLRAKEWTPELMDHVHSAGVLCFAFNAQSLDLIEHVLKLGADAVYSDHIDRLTTAFRL